MSCSYFDTYDKDTTRDQSEAAEAAEEVKLPLGSDYNDIYRNFVKDAQAEGIDPEDIRAVLQILKRASRKEQ